MGVTGAGAQQNPPVNEPGVTATQIRVGGVATVTGDPTGNTDGTAFDGTNAYFDYINSLGGVCGRKLVLASKRDDMLSNNREQVQGLISNDNVFAVLPVATTLFTGADLLAASHIPTFGWDINAEWGSEANDPGPPNLFGGYGSFINFSTPGPTGFPDLFLAKKLGFTRIGLVAYSVPQSADAANVIEGTFNKFPGHGKVVFKDTSLPFGGVDFSAQVAQMVQDKVQLVIPTLDSNGAFELAREMKKQGLNAPMLLPNAYNQDRIAKNADVANGSYVFTEFAPFESNPQPAGLKLYLKWIKKSGGAQTENSVYGWLNGDLFVTGLKAAGCDFTRQKVVDAINKLTAYNANGLIPPVNWTTAHQQGGGCFSFLKVVNGKFKPAFTQGGHPFLCFPSAANSIPSNPTAVG
ncbi:MAG TPA: ABC transporter substrate-binding protein [Acidimicrobiia bacterium]|nr:ABC transporter substrate-binding protein [Acidimicrobiia bacterium]